MLTGTPYVLLSYFELVVPSHSSQAPNSHHKLDDMLPFSAQLLPCSALCAVAAAFLRGREDAIPAEFSRQPRRLGAASGFYRFRLRLLSAVPSCGVDLPSGPLSGHEACRLIRSIVARFP